MTFPRFPKLVGSEARFIRLAKADLTAAEIAARMGVTKQAALWMARRLNLVLARPQKASKPVPPNVVPMVRAALAEDPAGAARHGVPTQSWPLHLAAYIANVELGFPARHVAPVIQRHEKLVRYAVRRIEDRRDEDPAFDAFLDRLGDQARELAA